MGVLKMNKYLILIAMILGTSPHLYAEITEPMKSEYIDASIRSCVKSQLNMSINASFPLESIQKYCRCNAVYMARILNNELANSIGRGDYKPVATYNAAGAYCAKNYFSY
jgi:hypothetical protein